MDLIRARRTEDRHDAEDGSALPTRVWRSRLSWKIATAVFTTILIVQGAILTISVPQIEQRNLDELARAARYAVMPLIRETAGQMEMPIVPSDAARLLSASHVRGLAVYGLDLSLLGAYGETTIIDLRDATHEKSYRSVNGASYEIAMTPAEIGRPYQMVLKIDSRMVRGAVIEHLKQSMIIMSLLSGFVTVVLMLALSQWLLEPIFVLRRNLVSAMNNPKEPELIPAPRDNRDELGMVMRITNDLIRMNAQNIHGMEKQAERDKRKLSHFDALTELANRMSFVEQLDVCLKDEVSDKNNRIAVFAIDLDHFKDINDTLGHEVGDRLLREVGRKLVGAMPAGALVARASADEFMAMVVLEEGMASDEIANHVHKVLQEPIDVRQERFKIRTSIGVAHGPEDGIEANQLIKSADIALNRAKQEGRDTIRFYSEDFDRAVQQRFQMLRDMREALERNEFLLHYQPQFDLRTGALIGAEALIRWRKNDNSKEGASFISPAEFIPLAESSGLIVEIGAWVLEEACSMNMRMQKAGIPNFRIAVNISGVQFHKGDIVGSVVDTLQRTGLDPHQLELEVTESAFMENTAGAIKLLHELHSLGCELAIDDFGTGYSSLSYLRQFPIDRLKIDQSFVRNAISDHGNRSIASTIITLGHSLGLKVIAEGVESVEHEVFLKEGGCDEVQGYRYSRPLPEDKFLEFASAYDPITIVKPPVTVLKTS